MADHGSFRHQGDLERALGDLAQHVTFPATPDLARSVHKQLVTGRPSHRSWWSLGVLLQPRRVALACFVLLLVAIVALVASPDLRTAVADRLGVRGIEIIFVEELPTPDPTSEPSLVGSTLLFGERLSLEEAQARVPYPIRYPAVLGPPDEVYLRQLSAGPMVTLIYLPRPGLPAAAETGVGALLMQFPAGNHPADIAKRVSMGSGSVTEVELESGAGFWLTGATEVVIGADPSADFQEVISRPSANVLIWDEDGVTYRLESDLVRGRAIALADDLTPAFPLTPVADTAMGTKLEPPL